MAQKTPPELSTTTSVLPADLVLTWSSAGPLKTIRADQFFSSTPAQSAFASSANYLVNPEGVRWVLRRTAPTDTQHSFDMWRVLVSNATAITVSQVTGAAGEPPASMRLQNSQAGVIRMGQSQALENEATLGFRGGPVTFSGMVRTSTSISVRYAVLAWSGAANSPPAEIVNDWTSATYTAGNFFINTAGFSVLGVSSLAVTANTWTQLPGVNVANAGSPNNIMVMYWTESSVATGVTIDFQGKLEPTLARTPFTRPMPWSLREQCDRYIQTTYEEGVAPGTAAASSGNYAFFPVSIPDNGRLPVPFRTRMLAAPTVTIYSVGTPGTVGMASDAGGANYVVSSGTPGQSGFQFINSSGATKTGAFFQYVADKQF